MNAMPANIVFDVRGYTFGSKSSGGGWAIAGIALLGLALGRLARAIGRLQQATL